MEGELAFSENSSSPPSLLPFVQIALKNYDPQRDKRFSGVFKLPGVPKYVREGGREGGREGRREGGEGRDGKRSA